MEYIYVKLFDKGCLEDNKLFLKCLHDPSERVIDELDLRQDLTTKEWYTTLEDVGRKGAEIVAVSPYEKEKLEEASIVKHIYIVKIAKPY